MESRKGFLEGTLAKEGIQEKTLLSCYNGDHYEHSFMENSIQFLLSHYNELLRIFIKLFLEVYGLLNGESL